eukprot:156829-Karenia_brevis.AAC.1
MHANTMWAFAAASHATPVIFDTIAQVAESFLKDSNSQKLTSCDVHVHEHARTRAVPDICMSSRLPSHLPPSSVLASLKPPQLLSRAKLLEPPARAV